MAIQGFADPATEEFFRTGRLKKGIGWANLHKVARRKLDMIHYAVKITDLLAPPNNHLEKLKDDLVGFYSIRINSQWRVIFQWNDLGPTHVSIVDYH